MGFRSGLDRSANGAHARAGAAGDAGIGVDHKLAVAFADGGNRTFLGAGAAGDTFISDYISHDKYLRVMLMASLYTMASEIARGNSK